MRSCHADHLQMRGRANEMSPASACTGSPVCPRLNGPLSEAEVAKLRSLVVYGDHQLGISKRESWYLKQAEG